MRAILLTLASILIGSCAFASIHYNIPHPSDYYKISNDSNIPSFSELEFREEKPFLGFECQKNADNYLEIKSIIPDSPAKESQLNVGDIILSIDKKKVVDEKSFYTLLKNLHIGDVIFLNIKRDNEVKKIPLRVGSIQ